jgi:hypothetical protein
MLRFIQAQTQPSSGCPLLSLAGEEIGQSWATLDGEAPMRSRIRFRIDAVPPEHAEIRAAVLPLIEEDCTVSIEPPPAASDEYGWQVTLSRPGRLLMLRVRKGTTPAGWADAIANALSSS